MTKEAEIGKQIFIHVGGMEKRFKNCTLYDTSSIGDS